MHHAHLFGRKIRVPSSKPVRLTLGGSLVLFGVFGFLPVLGFWMVPVGLTVLAIDVPVARRWRRRIDVAVTRKVRAWRGKDEAG